MCLLSLNDTEIKVSILSINNFKNNDDTIYLLEIDDFINYNDLEIMKIKNNIIYFSLFDTELINKLTNLDNKLSLVIEDIINSNNDIKVLFNDTFKYFPLLNNINDTFYIKVSNNNKTDLIKDMTIIYLKTTIQIYISSKYKCSYINQKISLININNDELSVIDYENLSSSDSTSDSYNSKNSDSTSDSYNSKNSDSTNNTYNSKNSDSTSNTYNSKNSDSTSDNNVNINNKFYDDTDSSKKLSDNDYNNTISDHTDENNYDNTDSIHTDNKEENKFTISENDDNENNKDNENEKKSIKFEKVNKKTDYKCNKCEKEYKFEKTLNNHIAKCKK